MIFLGSLFNISQKTFLTGNHLYWAVPGLCIAFFNIYHRVSLLFDPRIHDGLYVQILAHLGGWRDSLRDFRFEEGLGRESWGPSAVPLPPPLLFFFLLLSFPFPLKTPDTQANEEITKYQFKEDRGWLVPSRLRVTRATGAGGDGKEKGGRLSLPRFPSSHHPLRHQGETERETTGDESGTDGKLLLLEISKRRNCSSVGCLQWVQFHNWFRLH